MLHREAVLSIIGSEYFPMANWGYFDELLTAVSAAAPFITRSAIQRARLPQVVVGRELHEFELCHQHRFNPLALHHFVCRKALAPPPAVRLREIGERAGFDGQALEAFE
jgi:hypothetical protein